MTSRGTLWAAQQAKAWPGRARPQDRHLYGGELFSMGLRVLTRRFQVGVLTTLTASSLLLSACGGDNTPTTAPAAAPTATAAAMAPTTAPASTPAATAAGTAAPAAPTNTPVKVGSGSVL